MTTQLPPVLRTVMRSATCAGCGLCAGLDPAIAMERESRGWWRPKAVGTPAPTTNAILANACPGYRVSPWDGAGALPEKREIDPRWGPWHEVMTAWATDPEVRHTASSGGALSAIAIHLLQTGQADRVLHVAMDPDAPLLTQIVRSTGRADVVRAAGSRYAPAAPLAELMAELETPGRILFIGKPCDAGAVRQLTQADPAMAERFPYILSFFCAGTPSQTGTNRILDRLGVAPEEVAHFRYRGDGWPGYATATRTDGSTERMSYEQSWGEILAMQVQFRCKICPDSVGGAADIAAADAWYGDDSGYPAFEEAEGRSLFITRTEKGVALARAARQSGAIQTEPLAIDEIVKMQAHQAHRKSLNASRLLALALTGHRPPDSRGLKVLEAARAASAKDNLHSLAGTFRRIIAGKR